MVGFMKSALNLFGLKNKEGATDVGLDEFLTQLPEQMGYNVSFKRSEGGDEKGFYFEVDGEEVDSFLGESSDMLDALAHISMRVLRKTEGLANAPTGESQEMLRVIFDSRGFREKKTKELQEFAAAQRQKVIESGGKPAYVPALGPSERKVVHTHLADLGEVLSESIGRGNFKRIRVRLKEDSTFRKPQEPREARPQSAGPNDGGGGGGGSRGPRHGGQGGGGNRNRQGGGGGGGGGRGRGPRPGGFGQEGNFERGQRAPMEGNHIPPVKQESHIDDNIGNRLRPGEEPLFKYSSSAGDKKDHGDEFDN